ncbi:MAG: Spi family protease inhibitor, partial [Muribaculaceae bacterium]|nr:Spi family protease inhibitor [Muribaculaceae bacterium]
MRKLLLIAALLFAATSVMAGNVDLLTAQTKAANFLKSKAPQGRLMTSAPTVKWTHEVKNSSNASLAAYYIVNTDKGYVIVAGDDRAREILAYGDGQLDNLNDLPEAMQLF